MSGIKRLFLDIETSPNVVCSWRCGYKISLDYQNILKERAIICIGYKWEGDKAARVVAWDADQNDKSLLAYLSDLIEQADEIVGHNIDRFDMPWIKTRVLFHKLKPLPHNLKTADTLQWAKRYFLFNSNRLDYLARYLGIGCKIKTEFALWKNVLLDRNNRALQRMKRYCRKDVELLERVYRRLAEMAPVKTHVGVLQGNEKWSCPHCGSENVARKMIKVIATGIKRRQMRCKECWKYYIISMLSDAAFGAEKSKR